MRKANSAWDWRRSAEIAWKQSQMEPGRKNEGRGKGWTYISLEIKIISNGSNILNGSKLKYFMNKFLETGVL